MYPTRVTDTQLVHVMWQTISASSCISRGQWCSTPHEWALHPVYHCTAYRSSHRLCSLYTDRDLAGLDEWLTRICSLSLSAVVGALAAALPLPASVLRHTWWILIVVGLGVIRLHFAEDIICVHKGMFACFHKKRKESSTLGVFLAIAPLIFGQVHFTSTHLVVASNFHPPVVTPLWQKSCGAAPFLVATIL